ncbi:MAG: MFS transporter [Anaerolineales bacterium]
MKRYIQLAPWQRNLWSTVVAEILTLLAFNASSILIPYYIQQMGVIDTDRVATLTGIYQSAAGISFAIFTPIWGALGDRYGRKLMLARAMIATALVLLLMGFARNPTQLIVLRIIQGCVTGTPSAASALLATSSPREHRAYALGLLQTSLFIGSSLGPTMGGYVADAFSYRTTFFASSLTVILAFLIMIAFVREPERSKEDTRKKQEENPPSTFGDLLTSKTLVTFIVVMFATNITYNLLSPVLPIYIQTLARNPGRVASIAGTIQGISALTAAISALVVGRLSDRMGHHRALIGCFLGTSIFYLPQAFVRSTTTLGAMLGLQGLFRGGISPNISATVVDKVSEEKAGVALGLTSSASSVGSALGPMLGASLLTATTTRTVYLVAAALYALITIALVILGNNDATSRGNESEEAGAQETDASRRW